MNATSSRLLSWGTIAHGFADTDGPGDDGAAPELQMVQRGDFPEVDVDAGQEIQREGDQPKPDHRVGEPESAGVEVKAHEPHDRDHEHGERHVRPACVAARSAGVSACILASSKAP